MRPQAKKAQRRHSRRETRCPQWRSMQSLWQTKSSNCYRRSCRTFNRSETGSWLPARPTKRQHWLSHKLMRSSDNSPFCRQKSRACNEHHNLRAQCQPDGEHTAHEHQWRDTGHNGPSISFVRRIAGLALAGNLQTNHPP
jgi:hypothetical protein